MIRPKCLMSNIGICLQLLLCAKSTYSTNESDPKILDSSKFAMQPEDGGLRWAKLHDLLYTYSTGVNLTHELVRSTLTQMMELENTGILRSTQARNNFEVNYAITNYYVVAALTKKKLLLTPDGTLTESLLETFNVESANCVEKNLRRLTELVDAMKKYRFHSIVSSNLHVQYQICLGRYMESLQNIYNLLGRKDHIAFNSILSKIHNRRTILKSIQELKANEAQSEVKRYAGPISDYMLQKVARGTYDNQVNYLTDFNQTFKDPCKVLIPMMAPVMSRMSKVMSIMDKKWVEFMTDDHLRVINTYKMCVTIVNGKDLTSVVVRRSMQMTPLNAFRSRVNQEPAQYNPPAEINSLLSRSNSLLERSGDIIGPISQQADPLKPLQPMLTMSNTGYDAIIEQTKQPAHPIGHDVSDKNWLSLGSMATDIAQSSDANTRRARPDRTSEGLIFESLPVNFDDEDQHEKNAVEGSRSKRVRKER